MEGNDGRIWRKVIMEEYGEKLLWKNMEKGYDGRLGRKVMMEDYGERLWWKIMEEGYNVMLVLNIILKAKNGSAYINMEWVDAVRV